MTQIIYNTATSLDGFLADNNNSLAWLFAVDQTGAPNNDEFMSHIGVLVQGSTTYEWVLQETQLLERPDQWQNFYGDRPSFVFTSRELPVPLGADVRFLRGRVEDHLKTIRQAASGKDIWVMGGGDLVGQFADAGALNRIEVTVAPVTLGSGAPLLPRAIGADRLTLIEAAQYGQFANLVYEVDTRVNNLG
ncbi:dihydrofolate reductase family protein [Lysinibacter sp. HNR]|uniref:dihydrofolate reductase family protein n=1 Tax=Lysinibacter sp. HNR TaxID=3031408 RepID=UPI0024348BC9|nr:dihydrofolate reductase family protein [Lysinibacter sp. HNR]WGD38536.1 dihydrofolate reductase family protein [Lysinibacter sp. HNR]